MQAGIAKSIAQQASEGAALALARAISVPVSIRSGHSAGEMLAQRLRQYASFRRIQLPDAMRLRCASETTCSIRRARAWGTGPPRPCAAGCGFPTVFRGRVIADVAANRPGDQLRRRTHWVRASRPGMTDPDRPVILNPPLGRARNHVGWSVRRRRDRCSTCVPRQAVMSLSRRREFLAGLEGRRCSVTP